MIIIEDGKKEQIKYTFDDTTKIKAILDVFTTGLSPNMGEKNIFEILRDMKRSGKLNAYNRNDVQQYIEKVLFGL